MFFVQADEALNAGERDAEPGGDRRLGLAVQNGLDDALTKVNRVSAHDSPIIQRQC